MTTPIDYLEAAKREEIVEDLQLQGYHVTQDAQGYDLVAQRADGKKIAVEVKAHARLRTMSAEISALRQRALTSGFAEFQLVIVNPPHTTDIMIEGLAETLLTYLTQHAPAEQRNLAATVIPTQVSAIDLDRVQMTKGRIHLVGTGVLSVLIKNGEQLDWTFPITFDLWLDSQLHLYGTPNITIDYTSYLDQLAELRGSPT